jgi:alpha-ribazole phosphatase
VSLLAFRHAPVALVGVCYGQLDVDTTLGASDAAAIIDSQLTGALVERIWSSPLRRCAEPARLLARRLGVTHTIDPRVAEIAYGAWEGRAWDELEREQGAAYVTWMDRWKTHGPPGGESAMDVEQRVRAWHQGLVFGETDLLIAHAGVVRALAVITRGQSWEEAMGTRVPHLSIQRF